MLVSSAIIIFYLLGSIGSYNTVLDHTMSRLVFVKLPEPKLEFINTNSAMLDCVAHGKPNPMIKWFKQDGQGKALKKVENIPNLLSKHENGSLIFHAFKDDRYIQEVHATSYICEATNIYGKIISVPTMVKATTVGQQQQFQAQVYDEFVIEGNVAVLKCHIPTFFKDELEIISWIREDNIVIKKGEYETDKIRILSNGNLYVETDDVNLDFRLGYWCQVQNRLSKKTFLSQTAGRIKITKPKSSLSPTITDIPKIYPIRSEDIAEIFCLAQGYPPPQYEWYSNDAKKIVSTNSVFQINKNHQPGTYKYTCVARNTFGTDRKDILLVVKGDISVTIEPNILEIKSGGQIKLNCKVEGYPIVKIKWAFNGEFLSKFISRELIIPHSGRENEGMYQCFVSNNYQEKQSTAQVIFTELAPSFLSVFNSKKLQPGPSVTISCESVGKPIPNITWTFNGKQVANNFKYDVENSIENGNSVIKSSLIIKNIRTIDGGLYSCTASNSNGQIKHRNQINVYGLPIVHQMENLTIAINDDARITCYTSGYPIASVRWERGGRFKTLPDSSIDFKNGTLILRNLKKELNGEYICVAKNGRGQVQKKSMFISILEKPQIGGNRYQKQSLIEGQPFTVLCNVIKGDEPVKIMWMKDGKKLNLGPGKDISTTKMYSVLQIRSITDDNSGNYSCVASNSAGKDIITYELNAFVKPKFIKTPIDRTVRSGDNVTFSCTAEGYPVPNITWVKVKDREVFEKFSENRTISNNDEGILKIIMVKQSDAGTYSCIVSNGIGGKIVADAELIIKDLPQIFAISKPIEIISGKNISLFCSATPKVAISWFKNGKIKIKASQLIDGDLVKSIVNIYDTTISNNGEYTCEAKNQHGTVVKSTSLKILRTIRPSTTSTVPSKIGIIHTMESTLTTQIPKEIPLNTIYGSMEQMSTKQVPVNKKDEIDDRNEIASESTKYSSEYFNFNNLMFLIPAITVIILLIAVLTTLAAYLLTKRSNAEIVNQNMPTGLPQDKGLTMKTLHSNNSTMDRRYGRLERRLTTPCDNPYNGNRSSGAYEIPDYYSGIKPYSTLQIPTRNIIDEYNPQNQSSV